MATRFARQKLFKNSLFVDILFVQKVFSAGSARSKWMLFKGHASSQWNVLHGHLPKTFDDHTPKFPNFCPAGQPNSPCARGRACRALPARGTTAEQLLCSAEALIWRRESPQNDIERFLRPSCTNDVGYPIFQNMRNHGACFINTLRIFTTLNLQGCFAKTTLFCVGRHTAPRDTERPLF